MVQKQNLYKKKSVTKQFKGKSKINFHIYMIYLKKRNLSDKILLLSLSKDVIGLKKTLNFLTPIFFTFIVMLVTVSILLFLKNTLSLSEYTDVRNIDFVYAGSVGALLTFICVWLIYRFVHHVKFKQMGLPFNKYGVFITFISSMIMILLFGVFIFYSNKIQLTKWSSNIKIIYIIQVILLYLTVGINEEVLFRGYLHKFYKKYGKVVAYLISVSIFVSIHFFQRDFYFPYLIELITATLLLTVIYDLSNSIWPGIILHMLVDACLSLTNIGVNSGSLISMVNSGQYDKYREFNCYATAIINIIVLIVIIIFYQIVYKKMNAIKVSNTGQEI